MSINLDVTSYVIFGNIDREYIRNNTNCALRRAVCGIKNCMAIFNNPNNPTLITSFSKST